MQAHPVWFVTGCSTGFGREIARAALARGGRVVATARDAGRVADLADGVGDRLLALALDVTDAGRIGAAVEEAVTRFGRVDVLVNNAGYGYQSSVEEGVEDEIRAQFDANVFGLFALTRAVLPHMRAQGGGHVINISSVAGLAGFPGSGYYAASKHAVEGWSDALAAEGEPLGIKVTCVEPGPFRTDWAGRSLHQTPVAIEDYQPTAGARLSLTAGYSGKQPGDPARAAEAIVALTEEPRPPRHLPLGRFAYETLTKRLRDRLEEMERRRDAALGADFLEE